MKTFSDNDATINFLCEHFVLRGLVSVCVAWIYPHFAPTKKANIFLLIIAMRF
jgi:hypothetical protein